MNEKGKGNIGSYIAVVVILVCALIFIFYLLETEKTRLNAKPMTEEVTKTKETTTLSAGETTTTTIVVNNNEGVSTPINVEPVSNFDANLSDIIGDLGFFGNYNVTTFFHGVEFTFKCNNYDEPSGICSGGSALMKVNDALYPLYTYTDASSNFLLRGEDYYILLNDDMVLLYTSNINSTGNARIFDLRGTQVGALNNTLTSYKLGESVMKKLYPNIEDNKIYYYSCNNNQVVVNSVELGNYEAVELLETIEGSCY